MFLVGFSFVVVLEWTLDFRRFRCEMEENLRYCVCGEMVRTFEPVQTWALDGPDFSYKNKHSSVALVVQGW